MIPFKLLPFKLLPFKFVAFYGILRGVTELEKLSEYLAKIEGAPQPLKFVGFSSPKKAVCSIPPLLKCSLQALHFPPCQCRLWNKKYCS